MKNHVEKSVKSAEVALIAKQNLVDELIRKASKTRKAPASINGLVVSREEAIDWDFR